MVGLALLATMISLWLALKTRNRNLLVAFRPFSFAPITVGLFGTFNRLLAVLDSSMAVEDAILFLEMVFVPLIVSAVLCVIPFFVVTLSDFLMCLHAEGYRMPKLRVSVVGADEADSLEEQRPKKMTYDELVSQMHRSE